MNFVSLTTNSLRQQFSAFAAFHFAQKRVFHVITVPSISLLHLGRVGTLLDLRLVAWHNLGRWEALGKLSHCIGRLFSFSECPTPRWRCCDAISMCDYIRACPLHDWTHHTAHYSHQIRDRASQSRFACMQSWMQNRVFRWRRSTKAHAIQSTLRRAASKHILTPKSFKWSMGAGIITQHNLKPQKSVVFQPSSLQGFKTQLNIAGIFSSLQLETSCCHNAFHFSIRYCIATIRLVLPSDRFPTLQVLQFCIYAISHFASQRRIRLMVFAFAGLHIASFLETKANKQHRTQLYYFLLSPSSRVSR